MTPRVFRLTSAATMLAVTALPACGQGLDGRIAAAPAGNVSFHFAARPGICGDGHGMIRVDGDGWYGTYGNGAQSSPCEAGPVRVVLMRDGGELLQIQTFAGPLVSAEAGVTDLGAAPAASAAAWLIGVASKTEGRPARDALLPAMLADSADVSRDLLTLARDESRPREVRRGAMAWLIRRLDAPVGTASPMPSGVSPKEVVGVVTGIAKDENQSRSVRESAVNSLTNVRGGDAYQALVALGNQTGDAWLAQQAVEALARSGDPRSRAELRKAAQREDLGEPARIAAIQGIAGEYATAKDGDFLRELYPTVQSDRMRAAVMGGAAGVGGKDNRAWIMSIARDKDAPIQSRKRAVELADRVSISAAELSSLYESVDDPDVRSQIIAELGQNGSAAASDKLLAIAKGDPQIVLRRRAISALGRFDDPKVREALKGMVERK